MDNYVLPVAQFDVTLILVFRRREDISNICCAYVQYIQSAGKSQPHGHEILKMEYSEVTIKE
jgi:hypothetical protein